jgi:hypothetical protein
LFFAGASGQHVAAMFRQSRKNSRNLCGTLSWPENHLRHAIAQRPVMIDFSEAHIFEGKMAQTLNRIVRRESAGADLVKQLADGL